MSFWFYPLASVILISLFSFIGIFFLVINERKLRKIILFMVSFATGGLLGGVFFHLLPEAARESGLNSEVSLSVLAGLLTFFILEKFICWRHCHIPVSKKRPRPIVFMSLIGDGIHNFIDGMIVAASFLINRSLGVVTTLAIISHEIPQEIGDFGVLIYGGFSKKRALIFNFFSSLTAISGAVLTLLLGIKFTNVIQFLVPFAAGGFLYIGGSDLIPELHKEIDFAKSLFQMLGLALGIGVMLFLK